jgi:hypothetical protein
MEKLRSICQLAGTFYVKNKSYNECPGWISDAGNASVKHCETQKQGLRKEFDGRLFLGHFTSGPVAPNPPLFGAWELLIGEDARMTLN